MKPLHISHQMLFSGEHVLLRHALLFLSLLVTECELVDDLYVSKISCIIV